MVVSVAPRGGRGDLVVRRTRAGADEDPVVVEILEQIIGDLARGNGEGQAAAVADVDHVAARGDQQQPILLRFRARGDVVDAVRARDIPVLVGDGCDRGGGGGVALRLRVDLHRFAAEMRKRARDVALREMCCGGEGVRGQGISFQGG